MSIIRDNFAMGVYHYNQQYTPQQVADYILNTHREGFADPQKLQALIEESQAKFKACVEKHKLTMDQMLQSDTSSGGRELAELTLSHCDKIIKLIIDGAASKGTYI